VQLAEPNPEPEPDLGGTPDHGDPPLGTFCSTVAQGRLCEDFETGFLDGARWTADTTNTTVTVAGSPPAPPPHGGTKPLHIHAEAVPAGSNVQATIYETSALPSNQTFYVRLSAYASAWPPTAPGHNALVRLSNPPGSLQTETNGGYMAINSYGGVSLYKQSAT